MNPNHLVSNNVFNGILDGSQAAGMNVNPMFSLGPMAYNIPSGSMFSPAFPSQPVNYCAMGNFLTQQQFLSTMSNFQQVGNLQSQNTGVSHAAGTKGVYSSPLPDIFNPNSPTRTPSSVMNSSKKEETKAFDFISGALDGGLDIPHSDKRFSGFSKDSKQLDAEVHLKYIYGGHVAAYMKILMEDEPEKYRSHFVEYIKKGIEPDGIEELYKKVHAAIRADPTQKKSEKEAQEVQLEEADV